MSFTDDLPELCPHCNEPPPRGRIDEHVATNHADIPSCTATLQNQYSDGLLRCVLRVGHEPGYGEYGGWHVSAHGPAGRTVWQDWADGATPHADHSGTEVTTMASNETTVTVDIAADLTVIRPGDTILVRMPPDTHHVQLKTVADRLRERLPDVEVLLLAGVDGIEVYRPEAVHDVQGTT